MVLFVRLLALPSSLSRPTVRQYRAGGITRRSGMCHSGERILRNVNLDRAMQNLMQAAGLPKPCGGLGTASADRIVVQPVRFALAPFATEASIAFTRVK